MVRPIEQSSAVLQGGWTSDPGMRVVESAVGIARDRGQEYARGSSPVSPEPRLTGNAAPGETPLRWLKGHNKCNQFVGDVLYGAGFRMPMFVMEDGSHHYMHAAALPGQRDFFQSVTRRDEVAPGDILVIRGPGRGENSGHVEIVTEVERGTGLLTTLGAHPRGVEERVRNLGERESVSLAWNKGNARWFVLRPYSTFSIED